jgi:hypothetical protein
MKKLTHAVGLLAAAFVMLLVGPWLTPAAGHRLTGVFDTVLAKVKPHGW